MYEVRRKTILSPAEIQGDVDRKWAESIKDSQNGQSRAGAYLKITIISIGAVYLGFCNENRDILRKRVAANGKFA